MPQITIRPATPADYETLCQLFTTVDQLHIDNLPHIFQQPTSPAREESYLLERMADETVGLFIAEMAGAAVGLIEGVLRYAPYLPMVVQRKYVVVETLAVVPSAQRQGVGQALMAHMETWAREQGAENLDLSVWAFNEGALAFYEQLGYEVTLLRMAKWLERE